MTMPLPEAGDTAATAVTIASVTEEELRIAYSELNISMPYAEAMDVSALAISIRNFAEARRRRRAQSQANQGEEP